VGCDSEKRETITKEPAAIASTASLVVASRDEHTEPGAVRSPLAMPLLADGRPRVHARPPAADPECEPADEHKGPLSMGLRHGAPGENARRRSPLCMPLK
jgi:hypothetical protein